MKEGILMDENRRLKSVHFLVGDNAIQLELDTIPKVSDDSMDEIADIAQRASNEQYNKDKGCKISHNDIHLQTSVFNENKQPIQITQVDGEDITDKTRFLGQIRSVEKSPNFLSGTPFKITIDIVDLIEHISLSLIHI